MKKKLILIFIALASFVQPGCNDISTTILENPNDPESYLFQGNHPSIASFTSLSANSIKFKWDDNSNFENSYVIQRSTNGGKFDEIATLPANSLEYTDTTLNKINTYSYRIRCISSKSNSAFSDILKIEYDPYSSKQSFSRISTKILCFSPDDKYKAASSSNGNIIIYNTSDNSIKSTLKVTSTEAAFTMDSNFLIVVNNQNSNFEVWDIGNGNLSRSFPGYSTSIKNLVLSSDNHFLAGFSSRDSLLKVWDFDSGKEICRMPMNYVINRMIFSKSGKYLAVGNYRQLFLIETNTWNVLESLWYGLKEDVPSITFSPDDSYLFYKNSNNIYVWDIQKRSIIKNIAAGTFACSLNFKFIAFINPSGFLQVWQMDNFSPLRLVKQFSAPEIYNGSIADLHISNNGDVEVLGGLSSNVTLKYIDNWVSY